MRAQNGKLYIAENRANRVTELTFSGDTATVQILKDGLHQRRQRARRMVM